EEVRVRQLRLAVGGNFSRRITLEADPKGLPGDLYDLMDEFLAKQFMRTLVFQVTQVTLEFRFAVKGRKGPKALKFELTFPNGSSLKSMREEDRALAEKYLKRWGIDRA